MEKPQPLFGLVLAPTRELAYQISQAFEALGSLINVRSAVIVGGMDSMQQAIGEYSSLNSLWLYGKAHNQKHLGKSRILSLQRESYSTIHEYNLTVSSPGRLLDHLENTVIAISTPSFILLC